MNLLKMGHIHHFVGEMTLFFGLMIYLMFYLLAMSQQTVDK